MAAGWYFSPRSIKVWVGDEPGHDIVLKLFGSAASSISLKLSYLILGMYNYGWSARVAYLKVYKMEDM